MYLAASLYLETQVQLADANPLLCCVVLSVSPARLQAPYSVSLVTTLGTYSGGVGYSHLSPRINTPLL